MATSPPTIAALPTAPTTASPATFDATADAFVAALPTFRTESNAVAANVYANALDAAAQATAAAYQVTLATAQVGLAATQVGLASGHATTAEAHKNAAGAFAAAAAIAAGAAIPSGSGQLLKTEGAANIKTANFAAATGRSYDCNTTAGGFTATLPATPTIGDWVQFTDHAGTWGVNPLIVARNGSLLMFLAEDMTCQRNRASFVLHYLGGTKGWSLK